LSRRCDFRTTDNILVIDEDSYPFSSRSLVRQAYCEDSQMSCTCYWVRWPCLFAFIMLMCCLLAAARTGPRLWPSQREWLKIARFVAV